MARTKPAKGGSRPADALPYADTSAPINPAGPAPHWKLARLLAVGIVLAYLVAMVAVCAALPGVVARGNETTWDRAVFTAVNAATLTGFQQTMGVREMRAAGMGGPILLLVLTFAGSLTTLIVGGLAASRVLRLAHTPRQIILAAVTAVLLSTLGGAAALTGSAHSIFEAIFQSTCAFGNSGLWLGPFPSTTSAATYLVLLPLAVLGGLGLPVLMELTDRIFGGPALSRHSRVVLMLVGLFYLGGLIALVLAQTPAAASGGWPAWRSTFASCSIAAVNTRSAGLPFQSPAAFTAAGQWLLMALMLIGAAPAGTAGGIKTTTLWQLGKGIGDALRGRVARRATGIAAVWVCVYVLMLFAGILLLVDAQPQLEADRLLFLAFSAIGNVGLSHDPVSITGPGLLILSGLMLAGRFGALAILWWMAETTAGAEVAVG